MVRKITESERLRNNMPGREARFEILREKVSKGKARLKKKRGLLHGLSIHEPGEVTQMTSSKFRKL